MKENSLEDVVGTDSIFKCVDEVSVPSTRIFYPANFMKDIPAFVEISGSSKKLTDREMYNVRGARIGICQAMQSFTTQQVVDEFHTLSVLELWHLYSVLAYPAFSGRGKPTDEPLLAQKDVLAIVRDPKGLTCRTVRAVWMRREYDGDFAWKLQVKRCRYIRKWPMETVLLCRIPEPQLL